MRTASGNSRTNFRITACTWSSSGRVRLSGGIAQQFAVQSLEESLRLPGRKVEQVRVDLAARRDLPISAQQRIRLENNQVGVATPIRKSSPGFIRVRVHQHLLVVGNQVASLVL